MTPTTDNDISEIKSAIDSNTKSIAELVTSMSGLREEMRVGFAKIEGKIDGLDNRLITVENSLAGLDARLWAFGGIILTAALGALWKLLTAPNG